MESCLYLKVCALYDFQGTTRHMVIFRQFALTVSTASVGRCHGLTSSLILADVIVKWLWLERPVFAEIFLSIPVSQTAHPPNRFAGASHAKGMALFSPPGIDKKINLSMCCCTIHTLNSIRTRRDCYQNPFSDFSTLVLLFFRRALSLNFAFEGAVDIPCFGFDLLPH